MALSATKVDVWNLALDAVGESCGLETETDDRPAALICARHYDNALRRVLEQFPWPFARRQGSLTATYLDYAIDTSFALGAVVRDDEVLYTSLQAANLGHDLTDASWWAEGNSVYVGWGMVYELPADCVTPLALLAEGVRIEQLAASARIPFELHGNTAGDGRVLCTNAEQSDDDFEVLEFTAFVDDVAVWTSGFLDAVALELAARIAFPLTKDRSIAKDCAVEAARALRSARTDALNARQEGREPMTPSLAARM